jgi:hypothetical protein
MHVCEHYVCNVPQLSEFRSRITYLAFAAERKSATAYITKMIQQFQHLSITSACRVGVALGPFDADAARAFCTVVGSAGAWCQFIDSTLISKAVSSSRSSSSGCHVSGTWSRRINPPLILLCAKFYHCMSVVFVVLETHIWWFCWRAGQGTVVVATNLKTFHKLLNVLATPAHVVWRNFARPMADLLHRQFGFVIGDAQVYGLWNLVDFLSVLDGLIERVHVDVWFSCRWYSICNVLWFVMLIVGCGMRANSCFPSVKTFCTNVDRDRFQS